MVKAKLDQDINHAGYSGRINLEAKKVVMRPSSLRVMQLPWPVGRVV